MRRLAWVALAAVLAVALVIGVTDREPPSDAERAQSIAGSLMCPACNGESVAGSQHPVAANMRRQIAQRIKAGESDQEIVDALAAPYTERIILNPPKSGVAGLVWVLPVAGLVAALAGLVLAFRRWRVPEGAVATPEDVAAAERARRASSGS